MTGQHGEKRLRRVTWGSRITCLGLLVLPLLLAAEARPDEGSEEERLAGLAIDRLLEGQARVMAIAGRVKAAGAELCGSRVSPMLGVYAANQYSLEDLYFGADGKLDSFLGAVDARFRLGKRPRLVLVTRGLPAARAGLRVGDEVHAVAGREPRMQGDLVITRKDVENGQVLLDVERDGTALQVAVKAEEGCAIPTRFRFGCPINAFATSMGSLTGVYFFSGLLRFFRDDSELSIIVGHELAHLVLGHTGHLRTSRRFEAEADYLGLYFAARAGFDISAAPGVWEKMARVNPFSSVERGFYSHPMSAERSLALALTVEEIEAKRLRGEPLVPDRERRSLRRPKISEAEVDAQLDRLRGESLALLRADQDRIALLSHRLVVAGAETCGKRSGAVLGAIVGRRSDFGRARKDQVAAAFGAGEEVTVFSVASGSPAARAGLRVGDRLLTIDGKKVKSPDATFDRLRRVRGDVPVAVRRGETETELTLPYVRGCAAGTLVSPSSEAGTWSWNDEMVVSTGLLRFAEDDDEVAIAIAHQLGHMVLRRHRGAEHEARADEIGLRIASAAGFDVSKAPAFWNRWIAEHAQVIEGDGGGRVPHGAMARRAPVIRDTAARLASATAPAE